jgi:hypothetical protein
VSDPRGDRAETPIRSPFTAAIRGRINLAKPKSLHNGAAHRSFAAQNHIQVGAINAVALREGDDQSRELHSPATNKKNWLLAASGPPAPRGKMAMGSGTGKDQRLDVPAGGELNADCGARGNERRRRLSGMNCL